MNDLMIMCTPNHMLSPSRPAGLLDFYTMAQYYEYILEDIVSIPSSGIA